MNGIAIFFMIFWTGYLVFCLVKRQRTIRENRICPKCGHATSVIWRGREVDARKEKVTFGGKRLLAGKATTYTSHLCCTHCDFEIQI